MPSYDELLRVCAKYTGANYYVDELIPQKKLSNARSRFPIPDTERVVALLDTTVFGSNKIGMAVCESGIRWRNTNAQTNKTRLSWDEFATVNIVDKGKLTGKIELGDGNVLELTGAFEKNDAVQLLSEIQRLVKGVTRKSSAPESPKERWMIAVFGQQYGPYDASTIKAMIEENRIDPAASRVWKEGMRNWVRLDRVPSLMALPRTPKVHAQSVPPPLPPMAPRTSAALKPDVADRVVRRSFEERDQAVDLNHASLDELLMLPGFSLNDAEQLVRGRESRRGFSAFEEVGRLLELQPHVIERLKERARITPYKDERTGSGRVVDF